MARQAGAVLGMLFFAHAVARSLLSQGSTFAGAGAGGAVATEVSAETSGCGESWQVVSPHPRQFAPGHHVDGQPIRCSRRAGDDPHEPGRSQRGPHTTRHRPRTWRASHWTGGELVAVGWWGTILTSPDGATWTSHNQAPTSNLAGRHMDRWRAGGRGARLARFSRARTVLRGPHTTGGPQTWRASHGPVVSLWPWVRWGRILTSPDGVTWASHNWGNSNLAASHGPVGSLWPWARRERS